MEQMKIITCIVLLACFLGCGDQGNQGKYKLHDAAQNGDVDEVRRLVGEKFDINGRDEPNTFTALHWAARLGHIKVVKFLISSGADINAMSAVHASFPGEANHENMMGASLDHAMWFHRPARADDWVLLEMAGHGMRGSRGLTTGMVFHRDGSHVAMIAQEGLLRTPRS